jgi:hypothetical protein
MDTTLAFSTVPEPRNATVSHSGVMESGVGGIERLL